MWRFAPVEFPESHATGHPKHRWMFTERNDAAGDISQGGAKNVPRDGRNRTPPTTELPMDRFHIIDSHRAIMN
jgi:hypothetical protein